MMIPFARITRRLLQLALFAAIPVASAADLRISLPFLPPLVESATKGPLAQLAQAIAAEWDEGQVTISDPKPFDQSVKDVARGKADLHLPMIVSPARYEEDLPYRYSTVTLFEVPFALYTRKDNKRVDLKELTIPKLSKLKLETDRAHARLFYFQMRECDSIDAALRRVNTGETDGYLFAQYETDTALKRLGYTNIVRTPYRRFDVKVLLPKGPEGDELDLKLTQVIQKLKQRGQYQKIMGPLLLL